MCPSAMLIVGELSSGIIVACAPTLGPVFFPKQLGLKRKTPDPYNDNDHLRQKSSSSESPFGRRARDSFNGNLYASYIKDDIGLDDPLDRKCRDQSCTKSATSTIHQ